MDVDLAVNGQGDSQKIEVYLVRRKKRKEMEETQLSSQHFRGSIADTRSDKSPSMSFVHQVYETRLWRSATDKLGHYSLYNIL
ncbi:hypothetical protein OIU74_019024 [Salix koriyanagi]|uniref:Uncharacterized protein n=1 Tax=Salix koriyanagi TaxID=2511006 RepID=A0A9Q0WU57_9ROSI|nr:hypothetical protein OIU74_019024 [Salix koriyanagi]